MATRREARLPGKYISRICVSGSLIFMKRCQGHVQYSRLLGLSWLVSNVHAPVNQGPQVLGGYLPHIEC